MSAVDEIANLAGGSSCLSPIEQKCVNTIRCLGAALPQAANSGHPGAPMGCAPIAHALYGHAMVFDHSNPLWWNRDRFVLSNGHACALQYTMIHLCGIGLAIDDLKNFRQLNSKTPGHPEVGHTVGIEVTTGPLGQGISQAVGLAIATRHMAARFNRGDMKVFDNITFALLGDGCLQEGVSSEACSLAGTLKLGNLIAIYDSNSITIDGATSLSFTEDVAARFVAYGWHVLHVADGDHDVPAIIRAIEEGKRVEDKPTLIIVTTVIGFGCDKQGHHSTHGAPLGVDALKKLRSKFGFPADDIFQIDHEVVEYYQKRNVELGHRCSSWKSMMKQYEEKFPAEFAELSRRFSHKLPADFESKLPRFSPSDKPNATRNLSNVVLNVVASEMPELIGGSADLTDSNKTAIKNETDFTFATREGRYLRFGVREHGMCAVANGLFAFGGLRPFTATFLNFVTYAWGAVRLGALSKFGILHIASHDSIELGEDGPTHQPIESFALVRATPNLIDMRPADGNEVSGAYAAWASNSTLSTVLALCRGNVPQLAGTSIEGTKKGGYVVVDWEAGAAADKKVILGGSGSELHLCYHAKELLTQKGLSVRIVSMPSWNLFDLQPKEYRESVLPAGVKCKAYVEAMSTFGWDKYFHSEASTGMNTFGASAPANLLLEHFGFTKEKIAQKVCTFLGL